MPFGCFLAHSGSLLARFSLKVFFWARVGSCWLVLCCDDVFREISYSSPSNSGSFEPSSISYLQEERIFPKNWNRALDFLNENFLFRVVGVVGPNMWCLRE